MTKNLGISREQSILSFVCPKKAYCNIQVYAILYYIMLLALFPTISSCTKLFMYMKNFARECGLLLHHHLRKKKKKKKKRYFDVM
jgi:hypothetical protein